MRRFRSIYVKCFNRLRFPDEVSTKLQKRHFLDNLRTITHEGNMETRQMTPFFHLIFPLCLSHSFLYLKIVKINFHVVLWSILVCKISQFCAKATDSDNPYYVLSPERSQKKVSAHGLM